MKNLVILGVPRAGKSTLAYMCARQLAVDGSPAALVSADALLGGLMAHRNSFFWRVFVRGLRHLFPSLKRASEQRLHRNMARFIKRFFKEMSDEIPIVFEGAYIDPNMAKKLFDLDKVKIVVVGYPNANADDKVADIRKFDKDTPISKLDDQHVKQRISRYIKTSKKYMEQSQGHFLFLDTSSDYHGVLDNFAKNVKSYLED